MGIIANKCRKSEKKNTDTKDIQLKIDENNCFVCKSEIVEKPDIGKEDARIEIKAEYKGKTECNEQTLFIIFNYPVTFISCTNGELMSPNDTTRIKVKLSYHINPNDTLEINDFIVKCSQNDLEIVECTLNNN